MEDDDADIMETKPSIISLLNRLYEQPSEEVLDESSRQSGNDSSNGLEQSLGTMSSNFRTTLEDRFLDYVKQYPCFYDPNDKNFVHNQYKSNMYGVIAKKLNAEGMDTTGNQLATLFKSMKAKYRDESRRLARMPELEASPFYLKLKFLEPGLNSVDQRLAKFRANGQQKTSPTTADKEDDREGYTTAIKTVLDRFTPEMREKFFTFITALDELKEPAKHVETFTRIAQELKNRPDANVEIANSPSNQNVVAQASKNKFNSTSGDLEESFELTTFEGQKDLLALFRVLENVITTLPRRRRHSHLQGLLNISSAALHAPVQISWQSEVFNPVEKCWNIANNTITIDGPSPSEVTNQRERSTEQKNASKRRIDPDESDDDNQSNASVLTDESNNRRPPRTATTRRRDPPNQVQVPMNKRPKRSIIAKY